MKTRFICAVIILGMLPLLGCSGVNAVMLRLGARQEMEIVGDSARGEQIFRTGVNGAPPCSACHQVTAGAVGFSLAPNLAGIAARAPERIATMTPEEYIEDSILHPAHYVVGGYHVSMFADYAAYLSPQDIADLTVYLMTR
jgi:mono/diheme cytochrome c family protein